MSRVDAMLTFTLFDVADSPVAFEFGTFGYYYKGDRPHETYAAFVYDDRFRLGVVKPTYDRVLISPFDFTAASIAETRAEYTRARATTEALRFNSVPVGVSYGDTTGDTSWAVSLLDASDGNFRSAAGSAEWRAQAMTFAAAIGASGTPRIISTASTPRSAPAGKTGGSTSAPPSCTPTPTSAPTQWRST